ncbi:MAG: ATP-binding cassette domain-containing protein, partial [Chthoniobacterales bacterium]|nr:ATP-binding cassette domain-containing protein [Chthoniobacterales bacterium]
QLEPSRGTVALGTRTEINYIDQNRMLLDEEKTVWDEVSDETEAVRLGEESISLRSYLRRFLFTEDRINTKIAQLSGGERSRVLLAKILKRGGNVLMLDEPTNDLDLGTLRLLEEALVAFGGCVIAVSHDRYFLNRVCTGILAFEGGERVDYHVGNYDRYLEKRVPFDPAAAPAPTAAKAPPAAPAPEVKGRKLKWKEARELETIEATILEAENLVVKMEEAFAAPDAYLKPKEELEAITAELAGARQRVAQLYARWEELEQLAALAPSS